jgi:outer membrane murein-binding lipoprotein Lpp
MKAINIILFLTFLYLSYAVSGCANKNFMYHEKKISDLEIEVSTLKARMTEFNRIDTLDKKVDELNKNKLDKTYIEREYNIKGVIDLKEK